MKNVRKLMLLIILIITSVAMKASASVIVVLAHRAYTPVLVMYHEPYATVFEDPEYDFFTSYSIWEYRYFVLPVGYGEIVPAYYPYYLEPYYTVTYGPEYGRSYFVSRPERIVYLPGHDYDKYRYHHGEGNGYAKEDRNTFNNNSGRTVFAKPNQEQHQNFNDKENKMYDHGNKSDGPGNGLWDRKSHDGNNDKQQKMNDQPGKLKGGNEPKMMDNRNSQQAPKGGNMNSPKGGNMKGNEGLKGGNNHGKGPR